MADRYVTLRQFIVVTGRWNLTDQVGADGEPILRPETREIAFGSEVGSGVFTPGDIAAFLAEGQLAPVDSPEAMAAVARVRAARSYAR